MALRNYIALLVLPRRGYALCLAMLALLLVLDTACSKKDSGAGETAAGGPASARETPSKPNVVLIVLDALRADRVGAERNGVPIMPNLAALAKESVAFSNASAPCTWTRPSMATLMTGVLPTRTPRWSSRT